MSVDTHNRMLSDLELNQLRERTNLEAFLTTVEAASVLRLRPQTLRRWASDGSGPLKPRRFAGRLRWSLSELKQICAGESVAT